MIKKLFNKLKEIALILLFKLLRIVRFGVYSHYAQIELSSIRQPSFQKYPLNIILLLQAILVELPKKWCFDRRTNTVWDSHINSESGDHYKILPCIVRALNAQSVVEIGTYMGASAYSIICNTNANVVTFDLIAWNSIDTYLNESDFKSDRVMQVLADVSDYEVFLANLHHFIEADLIFIDAPKNYFFEKKLLQHFITHKDSLRGKWLVFDDIRVSTMVDLWDSIPFEKLDLSGIGHWSGTGIVFIE
jgi:hypothetical protein